MVTLKEAFEKAGLNILERKSDVPQWMKDQTNRLNDLIAKKECVTFDRRTYYRAKELGAILEEETDLVTKATGQVFCSASLAETILERLQKSFNASDRSEIGGMVRRGRVITLKLRDKVFYRY